MKYQKTLIATLVVVSLWGCQKKEEAVSSDVAQKAMVAEASSTPADASAEMAQPTVNAEQQLISSANTAVIANRQFIRTANATFEVKDVYQASNAIEDAVTASGGFVVKNNINSQVKHSNHFISANGEKNIEVQEYELEGDLTVRVPSNKTQEFLRSIASQIAFLENRTFEAKDAQLDLLRQQLEQARNSQAVADSGNGTKLDNAYAKHEFAGARNEAYLNKKQLLDAIEYSTIDLHIYQGSKIRRIESVNFSHAYEQNKPNFFMQLWQSVSIGWNAILWVIVKLTILWPFALLAGLAVVGYKKVKAYKASKTPTTLKLNEKKDD